MISNACDLVDETGSNTLRTLFIFFKYVPVIRFIGPNERPSYYSY